MNIKNITPIARNFQFYSYGSFEGTSLERYKAIKQSQHTFLHACCFIYINLNRRKNFTLSSFFPDNYRKTQNETFQWQFSITKSLFYFHIASSSSSFIFSESSLFQHNYPILFVFVSRETGYNPISWAAIYFSFHNVYLLPMIPNIDLINFSSRIWTLIKNKQ